MSYSFYKILHLTSLFGLFLTMGSLCFAAANQISRPKIYMYLHGLLIFLSLFGGFGLMAKLSIGNPWPAWIYVKIAIWILFATLPVVLKKKADIANGIWGLCAVLGLVAAYIAHLKPF